VRFCANWKTKTTKNRKMLDAFLVAEERPDPWREQRLKKAVCCSRETVPLTLYPYVERKASSKNFWQYHNALIGAEILIGVL
jgi:hypothetical protein